MNMGSGSGNVREIEVRSLTGESIRVSIESEKTVGDLKLLLLSQRSFPPASSSPNFHLFLKGVKLDLKSQLSKYMIGEGDFIVIIPFVKKNTQQKLSVESSKTPLEDRNSNEKVEKELAESAWSGLMQDLSSLRDDSSCETPSRDIKLDNTHDRRVPPRATKWKKVYSVKEKGPLDDALSGILQTACDKFFEEHNLNKFVDFMDSSSCLIYPASGSCVFRETNDGVDSELDPSRSNISLCLCPPWLKDMIKLFSFINIYSACLQMWQKKVTISSLEGALEQLHKFGFRPGITDVELICQIFPQVLCIVNDEVEATVLGDALVIIKFSADRKVQHEDQLVLAKQLSRPKIISAMKKREVSLGAVVYGAVKSLMHKYGAEKVKSSSLEDFLDFVTRADNTETKNAGKRERRKHSAASISHSYEVQCCVSQILLIKNRCSGFILAVCKT